MKKEIITRRNKKYYLIPNYKCARQRVKSHMKILKFAVVKTISQVKHFASCIPIKS